MTTLHAHHRPLHAAILRAGIEAGRRDVLDLAADALRGLARAFGALRGMLPTLDAGAPNAVRERALLRHSLLHRRAAERHRRGGEQRAALRHLAEAEALRRAITA